MSYSFGWWDFQDGAEPQMICRDTDERVVMAGALAEPWLSKANSLHPELPQERWKRFEYRHAEFWFPLIVNWHPEEGKVLVDYNLSSELWRQETNAETEHPPYGGWVRVDDMVPDAFWCWPGMLEAIQAGTRESGISAQGGWSNGAWRADFRTLEHIGPEFHLTDKDMHRPIFVPETRGELASRTEYCWHENPGQFNPPYQDWQDRIGPLPELKSDDFELQFSDRLQYSRLLEAKNVKELAPSPWRFKNGDPENDNQTAIVAQRVFGQKRIRRTRLNGSRLSDGTSIYCLTEDGSRGLAYFNGLFRHEFRYFSMDLIWVCWCSLPPVVMWPNSDRGFYFSFRPENTRSSWGQSTELSLKQLTLQRANALVRDIIDAMLSWEGVDSSLSGWKYDGDYRINSADILKPVTAITGVKSQLAGRRVMDLCRVATYGRGIK